MDHDFFEILKFGSYFGAWLLSLINIGVSGTIGSILGAVLGAVVLLAIVGLFKK